MLKQIGLIKFECLTFVSEQIEHHSWLEWAGTIFGCTLVIIFGKKGKNTTVGQKFALNLPMCRAKKP